MILSALTFVVGYSPVILFPTPQPLSTPIRCLSLYYTFLALQQLATPSPPSTLPHQPRRCVNLLLLLLNPLLLPPSRPGRHRLLPVVPAAAHVHNFLSSHSRPTIDSATPVSILDDPDKYVTWQVNHTTREALHTIHLFDLPQG
jgi:hypothetical protein